MIGAIFATDENGGFGNAGKLPWHVPEDYRHFKRVTMDGTIVMGRSTFESLPKILPGRNHVVISSTLESGNGYTVYKTPEEALVHEDHNFWVIGGPSIIKQFAKLIDGYDVVYHSVIYGTYECDVKFTDSDTVSGTLDITSSSAYDDFGVTKYVNNNKI